MSTVDISPLPTRLAVRNNISDLIGRDVELADGDVIASDPTNVIAVYVTDNNRMTSVAVVDLAGACRLGGALGMLPKGGVDDAIDEKELPEMMGDCAYEVLNVLSAVFNVPDAPHVRLYKMYRPGEDVPNDVASLTQIGAGRMDLNLGVSGYGNVRLSLCAYS